jgi:signal peptidase II
MNTTKEIGGWWRWLLISVIVIICDQLSKWLIVAFLSMGNAVRLLPFLNFDLVYNRGAAFSFLSTEGGWQVFFLMAMSLAITGLLVYWLAKTPASFRWQSVALALIIGGALGNLIDRVRLHKVVDFIDFHINRWHFATFNVADMAVSIGVFILILCLFFYTENQS